MEIIIGTFIFILGSCMASFLGVVSFRVPKKISIIKPDSYCPSCTTTLKAKDNIPILGYILLKGRCRYCKEKIGLFSFIMEVLGGLFFLLTYISYTLTLITLIEGIIILLMLCLFIVISNIDYETHGIYNITLIIYFILSLILFLIKVFIEKENYINLILGLVISVVFFLLVKYIFLIILKKDGLGSGDIYLVGIAGLSVGVLGILVSIMLASLIGSIIEVSKIIVNKKKNKENEDEEESKEIAFGPYLLLGISIVLIFIKIIEKILLGVM